jgi:hypothetical protein
MGHGEVHTGMEGQCTLEEMELTARTRMEVSEKGKEELLLLRPAGQALT